MSIFDTIQNLLGGVVESTQGSVGDVVGGITEIPAVQDLQDHASSITNGASETVNSATEKGKTAIDEITQNLGL